ncbi:MAG: hypothetical protein JO189_10255, partial [Deltaproteobacteria bacterium]|nr:hypothetical protein [Deltaproteobacteria bacterium]
MTANDQAAAISLISRRYHIMLANTPAAKLASQNYPALKLPKRLNTDDIINSLPSPPAPAFYPDEVLNFNLVFTGTAGKTI